MKKNISDSHSHSILKDASKHTWMIKSLWVLAKELEPFEYEIALFKGFDEDCWFRDRHKPTINAVIKHQIRTQNADLQYPIILSENDLVMDGIHRICKAKHEGNSTVLAVKFETNPLILSKRTDS